MEKQLASLSFVLFHLHSCSLSLIYCAHQFKALGYFQVCISSCRFHVPVKELNTDFIYVFHFLFGRYHIVFKIVQMYIYTIGLTDILGNWWDQKGAFCSSVIPCSGVAKAIASVGGHFAYFTHTHKQTHTQSERERERKRQKAMLCLRE